MNQPDTPPIRLVCSQAVLKRINLACLVVNRWCRNVHNQSLPAAFVERLQAYGSDELDLANFRLLGDAGTFHLVKNNTTRPDSSATACIIEFALLEDPDTLFIRHVRKNDNDRITLHVPTGTLHCIHGHWMAGDHETTRYVEMPTGTTQTARPYLTQHLWNPRRWLSKGRWCVVRPGDLDTAYGSDRHDSDGAAVVLTATATGAVVPLGTTAVSYLHQGFTLLLIQGDLVRVDILRKRHSPLPLVGLLWKEGAAQTTATGPAGQTTLLRPDELAFILAERAHRRSPEFTGRATDHQDKPLCRFLQPGSFYEWGPDDVYVYHTGPWR